MKDRLLKFLNSEELSSARFAEIIDVQPSSVSHILSGRNKPGFDFIQKILINFPSLNADWLILGKGNMYKNYGVQRDLFSDNPKSNYREQPETEQGETMEQSESKENDDENIDTGILDTFVNKDTREDDYKSNLGAESLVTNVNNGKIIKRIVILYSDKSFDDYSPA